MNRVARPLAVLVGMSIVWGVLPPPPPAGP